jgi:hypothetical protein
MRKTQKISSLNATVIIILLRGIYLVTAGKGFSFLRDWNFEPTDSYFSTLKHYSLKHYIVIDQNKHV